MKAIVYRNYGTPDVLQPEELPKPIPQGKELLVRVRASSVTAGTIWMRRGVFPGSKLFTILLRLFTGITKPKRPVLGLEFSGIVEAIGNHVTQFQVGDEVYGTTTGLKQGAYAEYVCIPESGKQGVVAHKPKELTFEEAATLPIGAMTALNLLLKAKIEKSDKILIYGASGSVGTYAVQLANQFGAQVTAVCSNANLDLAKSIGAYEAIAYDRTDIPRLGARFDIIFDAVGKIPASQLKPLLVKTGRYVSIKSMTSEKKHYLDLFQQYISEGNLKPVIDRTYPLDQVREAHEYVELGHKKGNVVVVVADK
ncbi:NAD(P)-dependent alcohol dehydrogenase [Fluviicola taffensis]|uniref:NADPH:quinone reductase n=1 Tax=Fluviicola taffensis (strain DSM 16823 / NCIMB 13979 / RW262) TaxID=755732 RepID=F2IEN0_FLUTR|nr:NAD(P)-dependent alcohol dehydrogenase [Fluviicola taffensis]AEA44569.1 NADPH:quinone reductase [Fluviicola taffensis DSM 16823]